MSKDRYVISRRFAGLGDGIVSSIAAWDFAKRTCRTLAIDWRWSFYLDDIHQNAFAQFFEIPPEIDGVPIKADDSVSEVPVPASVRWRRSWKSAFEVVLSELYKFSPAKEMPHPLFWGDVKKFELNLFNSNSDLDKEVVLLQSCLNDVLPSDEKCRKFLKALKPKHEIQQEIDAFIREHFQGKDVIAVHVRHGNGGDIMDHAGHWIDSNKALDKIEAAIKQTQEKFRDNTVVFLCTDSIEVKEQLEQRIPQLLTRKKYFRSPGTGELHDKKKVSGMNSYLAGKDALIEMFLLAQADELILYPQGSFFSFYARIMNNVEN